MGVLGKDYLDLYRPLTHTKVQFGESRYWVEHNKQEFPYGTILTAILNYDAQPYLEAVQRLKDAVAAQNDGEVLTALEEVRNMFLQMPLYNAYLGGMGMLDVYLGMPQFIDDIYNELQFLEPLYFAAEDIPAIQKRYTWFLTEALDDGGQRRKKGQRKIPLADRIRMNWMDAYVSGVSLGEDRRVDAPNVQMQYAVLETADGAEIVEKLYFDRLSDFVYIELMKGLQKGFHPKCCPNCGKWFVQEPGLDFSYCANPSPQDPTKICRDIGSRSSFREKVQNNEIWTIHQRAYRKYYARLMKKQMTRQEFFTWAEAASNLRDELIPKYDAAEPEERAEISMIYQKEINQR